jgi:hypothetical protein
LIRNICSDMIAPQRIQKIAAPYSSTNTFQIRTTKTPSHQGD